VTLRPRRFLEEFPLSLVVLCFLQFSRVLSGFSNFLGFLG